MLILTTKSDDVDYDEVYEDGDYFYDEYEDDYDHYDDGFVGCVEDLEFVGWDDIIEYGLCSEGRHYCERCNRALSGSKPPAGDDQWAKHSDGILSAKIKKALPLVLERALYMSGRPTGNLLAPCGRVCINTWPTVRCINR